MPSSAIRTIEYNETNQRLFVAFVDGDDYAYDGVTPQTYQAFVDAPSRGQFFHQNIRDQYPHRRLTHRKG